MPSEVPLNRNSMLHVLLRISLHISILIAWSLEIRQRYCIIATAKETTDIARNICRNALHSAKVMASLSIDEHHSR